MLWPNICNVIFKLAVGRSSLSSSQNKRLWHKVKFIQFFNHSSPKNILFRLFAEVDENSASEKKTEIGAKSRSQFLDIKEV
jgi:hypothetical protein